MGLFEKVLLPREGADVVSYCAVIRAVLACRPIPYTIEFFNKCYAKYGFKVIKVVDAALRDLASNRNGSFPQSLEHSEACYEWLISSNLRPTINILVSFCSFDHFIFFIAIDHCLFLSTNQQNQMLRIACAQGSATDVEKILRRMQTQRISPNGDSYNTLLCRYATKGDQNNALRVLQQMHTAGYRANQYTYNQLLKLYMVLNNLAEGEKVRLYMHFLLQFTS